MLDKLTHLKQLEAESIHIIREVAAEFEQPGDALFHRQGLAVMLHLAMQGVLPRQAAVSVAAYRHALEVSGHDRFATRMAQKWAWI
jgi:3'-phosphoadenosine 5'-phosphosulfate sulfotransferase (PAPS reductase)/FAD synthetase